MYRLIKLEARGRRRLPERIGTCINFQFIGNTVLSCFQSADTVSVRVIQSVYGTLKAVGAAFQVRIRRRIRGDFFYIYKALERLILQFCPGRRRHTVRGLQPVYAIVLLITFGRADLSHIVILACEHAEQIGLSVFSCCKNAHRLVAVPGILRIGIHSVPGPFKRFARPGVFFDDPRPGINRGVNRPDRHALAFCEYIWTEGLLMDLISSGGCKLLQIICAGRAVENRLIPDAALAAHPSRNDIQFNCHPLVAVHMCFFRAGLVCVEAEIDRSSVSSLMKAVVFLVGLPHIRIRAGLLQDQAGRKIFFNKSENIGLYPVSFLLYTPADINMYFIHVRKRFGSHAVFIGGNQRSKVLFQIRAVIFHTRELRIAHGHSFMAGCHCHLLRIAPEASGFSQLLAIAVQHCIVIQPDHHTIRDLGDIGQGRPSGKSPVIRHYADTCIFIALFIADIDRRSMSSVSGDVPADPEFLIIDLRFLADNLSPGRNKRGSGSFGQAAECKIKFSRCHPGLFLNSLCLGRRIRRSCI